MLNLFPLFAARKTRTCRVVMLGICLPSGRCCCQCTTMVVVTRNTASIGAFAVSVLLSRLDCGCLSSPLQEEQVAQIKSLPCMFAWLEYRGIEAFARACNNDRKSVSKDKSKL